MASDVALKLSVEHQCSNAPILHRQSPTADAVKSGLEPNLRKKNIKQSQAADTFYRLVYVCLWDKLA